MSLRPDAIFAAALAAAAALLLAHATARSGDALGLGAALEPMLFPQIVLAVWLALAVAELVRSLRGGGAAPAAAAREPAVEGPAPPMEPAAPAPAEKAAAAPAAPRAPLGAAPVAAGAGLVLLYAAAMPRTGFLVASWGLALAIPLVAGYRRPLPLLAVGLLAPLALWYLFHRVLLIRLPVSGVLPGF